MSDSSPMIQRALLEVMSPEALRKYLRALRRTLRDRRKAGQTDSYQELNTQIYLVEETIASKEAQDD